MKYLLIRHGKTDATRLTRKEYGREGAPLNEVGIQQAHELAKKLRSIGVSPEETEVDSSEMLRAVQTAEQAGFKIIKTNSLLNEVNTGDVAKTRALLEENKVQKVAEDAAKKLLQNPPKAKIWVTHGLLIAAVKYALGMTEGKLEPDNCEIVEIDI